jgi:PPOX class probable F420-dependent enzyme
MTDVVALPPSALAMIEERNYGHLSTIAPDGWPYSTPVWLSASSDAILVASDVRTKKVRNIRSNGRVALSVHVENNAHFGVNIRGFAFIETDPDAALLNALSVKYFGSRYPFPVDTDYRCQIRILPVRCIVTSPQE